MAGISNLKPAPSLKGFVRPDQLDPELQSFLEGACLLLSNWFAKAAEGTPLPLVTQMPEIAPSFNGLTNEKLLEDIQLIMQGSYRPSHPGSLAHLDPPPINASIVADLISAGLNNNLLAEELSPSISKLERKLCEWFIERIGMPPEGGGVFASGGSLSNLMALVIARKQLDVESDPSACVLASEDAHVSLIKARRIMGLPDDGLQLVPSNRDGQISLELLEEKLSILKSNGKKCFAIVATAGTTVRGSIDPILKLSEICSREKIWLHVDAAIGGVFALSESKSSLVEGISLANSVTLNPQKLLGIAKTSSILLVSNRSLLLATFSTGLPYVEPSFADPHGGEIGIQGTRSAEALKLWLGLRQLGEEGINSLLDEAIMRKSYLEKRIDKKIFNIISGPLHIISLTPKNIEVSHAEIWSMKTKKNLLDKNYMVSRPYYKGRYHIKIVLGNPYTELHHLEELAEMINLSFS